MAAFAPKNPGYRAAAIAMFDGQPAMRTLGIVIVRLGPGEAELAMLHLPDFTQQNGFIHAGIITAGLDNACGVAAFTLMPCEADILTVEFKTTLLAPARGERFVFTAAVDTPGRTRPFGEAKEFAEHDGKTTPIATMTGTLMAMLPRIAASPAPGPSGA